MKKNPHAVMDALDRLAYAMQNIRAAQRDIKTISRIGEDYPEDITVSDRLYQRVANDALARAMVP